MKDFLAEHKTPITCIQTLNIFPSPFAQICKKIHLTWERQFISIFIRNDIIVTVLTNSQLSFILHTYCQITIHKVRLIGLVNSLS